MTTREQRNARARYVRALGRVYAEASPAAREYGADWYGAAYRRAEQLGERFDFTTAQAAGAIAALSPRLRWSENLGDAEEVLSWAQDAREAGDDPTVPYVPLWAIRSRCSAFSQNIQRAVECLAADDPLEVLRGPKQRAFYRNIMGDADGVTVDVWATRAATRGALDHPRGAREYELIASAYRLAAQRVGVTPRDFQAAVWIAVRGKAE